MHPRKLTLECILLYCFGIPIELRNIVVKDYFPFVPNALTCKPMLRWNINCSTFACVETKRTEETNRTIFSFTVYSSRLLTWCCADYCLDRIHYLSQCFRPMNRLFNYPTMELEGDEEEWNLQELRHWYLNLVLSLIPK